MRRLSSRAAQGSGHSTQQGAWPQPAKKPQQRTASVLRAGCACCYGGWGKPHCLWKLRRLCRCAVNCGSGGGGSRGSACPPAGSWRGQRWRAAHPAAAHTPRCRSPCCCPPHPAQAAAAGAERRGERMGGAGTRVVVGVCFEHQQPHRRRAGQLASYVLAQIVSMRLRCDAPSSAAHLQNVGMQDAAGLLEVVLEFLRVARAAHACVGGYLAAHPSMHGCRWGVRLSSRAGKALRQTRRGNSSPLVHTCMHASRFHHGLITDPMRHPRVTKRKVGRATLP